MASNAELIGLIIAYIFIVSIFIGIYADDARSTLGIMINSSNITDTKYNFLYDGNVADLGINTIAGKWEINSLDGLHPTSFQRYSLIDVIPEYASFSIGSNIPKVDIISHDYILKNTNGGYNAFYIGTYKTDYLLWATYTHWFLIVNNNEIYTKSNTDDYDRSKGLNTEFYPTSKNDIMFNYKLSGDVTNLRFDYNTIDNTLGLYIDDVLVETHEFDIKSDSITDYSTLSKPYFYRDYDKMVITNNPNLDIIGTNQKITVSKDNNMDLFGTVALLIVWNIDEKYVPTWFNLIFIKVPLLVLFYIILRL